MKHPHIDRFVSPLLRVAALGITVISPVFGSADNTAAESTPPTEEKQQLNKLDVVASHVRDLNPLVMQQAAPNLINVTTAEDITKLPDVNAAEAVRRLPGVSLETDTGEGRFINIRGVDADLNSTTFDNVRLLPTNPASPFGGGRAVAMDTIPAGLIGQITVTKTNLPWQDAEAIGGTIDIGPKTLLANESRLIEAHLGTGLETLHHSAIGDFALTAGGRFGGTKEGPFTLIATAARYEDKRGVDDIEAAYFDNAPATPDKAFAAFEQRFYNYHRVRQGAGLNFDYRPSADNSFYVRLLDTGYTESVNRQRLVWNFDGNAIQSAQTITDTVTSGGFDKTLRDEQERLDEKVAIAGGENKIADATLHYRAAYIRGSYTKFHDRNSDFNYTPASGSAAYDNISDPNFPSLKVTTPGITPYDPSNYSLASYGNSAQAVLDQERSLSANIEIPTHRTSLTQENIEIGLSGRFRQRNTTAQRYDFALPTPPPSLAAVVTGDSIIFYKDHYLNGPSIFPRALTALFPDSVGTPRAIYAAGQAARQKEDVSAAYAQYQFGYGDVSLVAGVRFESTRANYSGNAISDQNVVTPVSVKHDYTNAFPGAQLRWQIASDTQARVSYSSTIARPGFNQVGVTGSFDGTSVTTGNPDLKPTYADSFDLSLERDLGHGGVVEVGVFDKQLRDYIVPTTSRVVASSLPNVAATGATGIVDLISFSNGSGARARGAEFNYEQHFVGLPGGWSGFGVAGNYTFADTRFDIRPGESAALPSASRHTWNATLFYERSGFDVRLAGYYTSRNLFGIGGSSALDIFSEPRFSMDLGASYAFRPDAAVFFNVKNLTNTALKFTEGSSNRPIQREFYGPTLQAGITIRL